MTAYTLSKATNIRDLTVAGGYSARTSSDTIDTNGWNFTQDQDNRYGLSGNTSAVWGSLTINATKGGQLNFDGLVSVVFTGVLGGTEQQRILGRDPAV